MSAVEGPLRLGDVDLFRPEPAVELPGGLVRFGRGTGAWGGDFGLDPRTGAVWLVQEDGLPALFVNSSPELHARCCRLVAGLVPAITGGDPDGWERAKAEMQRVVAGWDAPAMAPDSYWDSVSWDVQSGNYGDQSGL